MPPRSLKRLKRPPRGYSIIEEKINELNRQLREAESETTEYKRSEELLWPIHRINHQKSLYVYQMLKKAKITRDVYDYCVEQRIIDAALIAKWKKPGFENLCCLQCIQPNSAHGGTCICRVPRPNIDDDTVFECKTCGCRGCCSGLKSE